MQEVRSVRDADVKDKRVLVRVDFNVPLKDGAVADDNRIKAVIPTLQLLVEHGAKKIIILTHVGRPEGKVVEELRVAPIVKKLAEYITSPIIEVHENLRFDAREEANDPALAAELAALGDIYVNDAFADSHRAHASIVGIPKLLPSYMGLLVEKEVKELTSALTPPQGAVAIIAGAKFETKIPLITALLKNYSTVLLGGALADDVLKARGLPVGGSLVSSKPVSLEIAGDDKIIVPTDASVQHEETNETRPCVISDIRAKEKIVDIGPVTSAAWSALIEKAPFVLWNGTLGIYEKGFVAGTDALAKAVAEGSAHAVIGGGDTAAAVSKHSFDTSKVFVSTGGGAMLEFLADGTLPGIEALKE